MILFILWKLKKMSFTGDLVLVGYRENGLGVKES
jgi:hypothetical protein